MEGWKEREAKRSPPSTARTHKRRSLSPPSGKVRATMNDTLMRHGAILRAVPRYPRRIDAPTLHAKLGDLGMSVSLRTIQRLISSSI